ncbi:MAG: hypothetical protein ACR2M1_15280 [Gemmatimonadaceae bacterium]
MTGKFAAFAFSAFAATAVAFSPKQLAAQRSADYISQGNAAYEARNAAEALRDYDRALALEPRNYEVLWKAARSGVDLGESESDATRRAALFKTAADRARLAVQLDSADANGHFMLARALGRTALSLGKRDQVRYAGDVRDQAMQCLKIDPNHAGCLDVLGMWNAEVMRLNGFTRMMARNFLGGKVFAEASWPNAKRYLEASVTSDPRRIIHRLDLAGVYSDMDMKPQARAQLQAVINGELIDYNDPRYKAEAATELKRL